MSDATPSTRDRILEAAFDAFMRFGYSGASTAQIARLARVSKRDLYAHFGSKQAMLAACVSERAGRMRQPLSLPTPTDRKGLHETLIQFGTAVCGSPDNLSRHWRRTFLALKLPPVMFHALCHTHASALIASGLDMLTISRRLGHGTPAFPLTVHGNLFTKTDVTAALEIEAAMTQT